MNLFRWTAIAGVVVASAGCGGSTGPDATARAGPVRLSVSSSSAEVVRGSPVTFRVHLVNEGTEATTLHFGDSCQIVPTIRNTSGEIVVPFGGWWGCLTVITQLTLLPGEPVVREFVWTGSTAFQSEMPLRSLPPGTYFFTAEVPQGEATLRATTEITLK
jgi:intracellular proteinase inhibitor BsuPI